MKRILTILAAFILAAIFNAAMDTIAHHFSQSIFNLFIPDGSFKNWLAGIEPLPRLWWIHPIFYDGWHFFKELMVLTFIWPVASYLYHEFLYWPYFLRINPVWVFGMIFISLALVWWFVFTVFYRYILVV